MKVESNIDEYIGRKIKYFRERKNITQAELAELLGTTSQTMSRYESGKRGIDHPDLFLLAKYFNVSINDFFPPMSDIKIQNEYDEKIKQLETETGIKISYPSNKPLTHEDYMAIREVVLKELEEQNK